MFKFLLHLSANQSPPWSDSFHTDLFFFMFHPDVPTSLSPRTLRSITSIDRRKWRRWSKSCSTRPPELHFDPSPLAFPTLPERTSSSTNTQHLLSLLSPCLCVMNVLYKAMNMMYLCKWAVPAQHFKLIKGTLWIGSGYNLSCWQLHNR